MSVAFTFLAKDPELSRLRALVEYLREVSDEFLFTIDSRTSYRTIRRIEQWPGARVFAFDWVDDFSAARNHALPQVQSEWTAYFDPDELPNKKLLDFIAGDAQTSNGSAVGWLFDTHNFWGGNNNDYHQESDWHCRMWRTGRGQFYKKVHEQVKLDGKTEDLTRGSYLLKAPADAFIIHAKPEHAIEEAVRLYTAIEERH